MIVVTGATGFVGSALVWELNQRGFENLILCDHVSPDQRPQLLAKQKYKKFVFAKELLGWLNDLPIPPQYIFHMGACSSTTETDEEYLRQNNTLFTEQLFDYCAAHNVPLQYASSGAVYGDGSQGFDDASSPDKMTPLNLYGWSKLNFDKIALQKSPTPPQWYGLRFFNVYGPNEYHKGEMSSVAYKAFKQVKTSGQLKLFKSHVPQYADGCQLRDFIYIKDITRWMAELMQTSTPVPVGIYNMGYGQARSWLDLATGVFKALRQPLKIDWIPIPKNIRNQYQYFTEAKMNRLFSTSLSRPQWPLEKGIQDYLENYLLKDDPYL